MSRDEATKYGTFDEEDQSLVMEKGSEAADAKTANSQTILCQCNDEDGVKREQRQDRSPRLKKRLLLTEFIRFIAIVLPIVLTIWRYGELAGYPSYNPSLPHRHAQYWGISVAILVAGSAVLRSFRRPSIVIYLLVCALPCLVVNLIGTKVKVETPIELDPKTAITIQIVVFNLVVTEWMAKLREGEFNFDVITAMGNDLFTAYDIIEMFVLAHDLHVFQSDWVYVLFALSFVSMFKFIPVPPECTCESMDVPRARTYIFCNLLLQDGPFLVVRVAIMANFGIIHDQDMISDLIHPIKSFAYVIMYSLQLWMLQHRQTSPLARVKSKEKCTTHSVRHPGKRQPGAAIRYDAKQEMTSQGERNGIHMTEVEEL
ncbi:uncharacterized protein LOC106168173 [Lingula anatina]|uniref:Uncharacterized protein LOC106168173 n=1 Tax=Lingula anatina TaxID=7574 RepID=A0A1S3IWM1_LINAN|nr:uncharacterized protein LOC106168173 [Lingula anatina]|eukprot:XP_013402585.1 uncharacterized protein LOC106168173 [Lingula anatina]